MGNEFGHPEWIDFPREGNGGSYHYARRQWSLADNPFLKYSQLLAFDTAMHKFARKYRVMSKRDAENLWIDPEKSVIAFSKGGLVYAFNFHSSADAKDFLMPVHTVGEGEYRVIFSSVREEFGDSFPFDEKCAYRTRQTPERGIAFTVTLPRLSCVVFEKVR